MGSSEIIKLVILIAYLLAMLAVGVITYKKNEGFQDYVLGEESWGNGARRFRPRPRT